MYLLVGLGNPGFKYTFNRHNIGYMVVDHLTKYYQLPSFKKKTKSIYTLGLVDSYKVILLKPSTYMNLSGESLLEIKSFFNIKIDNIFVFHDEIDLRLGEIKIKQGGGHNGHNGLKSIDNYIGSGYHRIRLGVDRPTIEQIHHKKDIISKWVLTDFTEIEKKNVVQKYFNFISNNLVYLISKEYDCLNNNFII